MKVLCFEGKRIVEREKSLQKITENIYVDRDNIYWYYKEVDKAIIIDVNRSYYTTQHYLNFENKMKKVKKDTIENYITVLDNRIAKGKYISGVEISLVADMVSQEKLKLYKSTKKTKCAVTVNTDKIKEIVERENKLIQEVVNEAIEKFKKEEYVENVMLKVYSEDATGIKTHNISLIAYLTDMLGIEIAPRVKGWINKNLKGCWGNIQVKCDAQSNKIFEILNSIMDKLKEN